MHWGALGSPGELRGLSQRALESPMEPQGAGNRQNLLAHVALGAMGRTLGLF